MTHVGRYRLLELAARGGFGEVWRAEGPDGRTVALKRLHAGSLASEAQRRRFATEVRALVKLRHPNLVTILDAGEEERAPFLVLEWVEGRTLAEHLEERGPLSPDQAVALVSRVAGAVAHAHEQGVLHRDLKPDNVLLRPTGAPPLESIGEPLLTDFGLARDLTLSSAPSRTGQGLGTPSWWPPEQARGDSAQIGPRSDVFGLGGLLYAALTGEPPHRGDTLQALLAALGTLPPAPGSRRDGVPRWLDAVCLSALDPDPARRPESAQALADALARGARPRTGLVIVGALSSLGIAALGVVWAFVPDATPTPVMVAPIATRVAVPPTPAPIATPTPPAPRVSKVDLGPARKLEEQGRWFEAKEALDAAIAEDPRCAEAFRRRARIMFRLGSPRDVLVDAERAIELDEREWLAHHYRGVAHAQLREVEAALADFDRAIALEPGGYSGITYRYRGMMKSALGDHAGALVDLERALSLGDNEPATVHQHMAEAYEGMGNLPAAIGEYRLVLEVDPNVPWAAETRASLRRLGAGTTE